MLPSIRPLQFQFPLLVAQGLKFGPETKRQFDFFAFVSIAKLIRLKSSCVAQYPATTIATFDWQATYKLLFHLQSSLTIDSKDINRSGNLAS